ncbi:MAG: TolC family protein [Rhodospirillales bacterium]|nr:TolC family protein [Rhodospirillales bacterium]
MLANSPDLSAAAEAVRAREGDARQASLWPNPALIGEAENFGGTGDQNSFETAEYTVSFAQPIDVSGKIRRRSTVADYERRLSGWDYETTRLDLITSTRKAYADLVATQRNVELTKQLARLADDLAAAVGARVQAGKVSPVEATRIEVVKSAARAEALRAEQDLSTARAALAALWGDAGSQVGWVAEEETQADLGMPPSSALEPLLAGAPEAARWSDEIALREAEFDLARATAFPDVTASLGARRFAENDDYAFVAGLSVPLPVFDRNQGAVAAATSRRTEAERRRAAFLARQRADFQAAYDAVRRAEISMRSLDDRIIPSAQSVFTTTTIGYQAGKFSLIDLLDAQRTLFEAQVQGVEARAERAKARADLERLIARPAEAPQQSRAGG